VVWISMGLRNHWQGFTSLFHIEWSGLIESIRTHPEGIILGG